MAPPVASAPPSPSSSGTRWSAGSSPSVTVRAPTYPFRHGGFSEYGYVYPTAGRVRVPDDVSDALASASACSLRTVMHGFERLGRIAATVTVVVRGAGPV